MRIVFLSTVFSYGGAQMSSIELAVRMRNSHEVKFFDTYGCSEPYIKALEKNELNYTLLSKSRLPYIVRKYSNSFLNIFRYFNFISKWLGIKKNVQKELLEFKPDVVILYDDRSLSYFLFYKRKNFRIIYYAREWYTPLQIQRKTRYLLKNKVDEIICISEATRHAIYCTGIANLENLYVVHNSINIEDENLKSESLEKGDTVFKIMHSGGFLPSKGQHIALLAAKELKNRGINFHLYLCGLIYPGFGNLSNRYYEEQMNFVKKNGLEDEVSFVIGKSNIIPYIKNSDIMFFPSSTEGLPRSVLEAMALGKPVVANAVGGVTDLILDRFTGFITKHNDPNDYADYAELLYMNTSMYKKISDNALNLIKTSFNEELQISKMNEVLSKK